MTALMGYNLEQIKDTLVHALHGSKHSVDMQGVLDIITVLEKFPITLEDLNRTNLAWMISKMKITHRDLARRAENLIDKWQEHTPEQLKENLWFCGQQEYYN